LAQNCPKESRPTQAAKENEDRGDSEALLADSEALLADRYFMSTIQFALGI